MTKSERCELVLNAEFYWVPMEFFQKRCDMIALRFFQDKLRGVVLDLFCTRAICSSATPAKIALSSLDVIMHATNFSMELLDRTGRIDAILLSARNVVRQRLLVCCFIDSIWSRGTPRYVTYLYSALKRTATSQLDGPLLQVSTAGCPDSVFVTVPHSC